MDDFPALQRSPAPLTPSSSDIKSGGASVDPWDYGNFSNTNHGIGKSDPWSRGDYAPPLASVSKKNIIGSSMAVPAAPPAAPPSALSSSSSTKASPSAAARSLLASANTNSSSGGSDANTSNGNDSGNGPYGLLGLLGVIRMTDPDRSMLALGTDLTTLGLDLNAPDSIYSTFISPWSDVQTPSGLNVEPGYYVPPCYRSIQANTPAHQRMREFSEEILFYMFYAMPRDVAQEAAAQELYTRGWRYHKELGMWIFKEADENGRPVQGFRRTSPNPMDRGVYVIFDPSSWSKVKREWSLLWDALEDRQQQQSAALPSMSSSSSSSTQQQQQQRAQSGLNMMTPPIGMSGRGMMI